MSELREAARRAGSIFIEQCEQNCRVTPPKVEAASADPVSELSRLMAGQGVDHVRIAADAKTLLANVQSKLPPELRDRFEDPHGKLIEEYLNQGVDEILARFEVSAEDA